MLLPQHGIFVELSAGNKNNNTHVFKSSSSHMLSLTGADTEHHLTLW